MITFVRPYGVVGDITLFSLTTPKPDGLPTGQPLRDPSIDMADRRSTNRRRLQTMRI